jgi:GAF domain-containing protein
MRRAGGDGDTTILLEIIRTVGSSLELDEVLEAVVRLLSDAAAVHACFVYLLDGEGDRLVLEAASAPYARLVGKIALESGEGLAWWALENRTPAFIRENALADPRVKFVPELEEEQFQSLVAVPILARSGDGIGAILLQTVAPREFTQAEADVLVSSASLVAGAIDNARLYAETRQRVGELEHLTELAERVARAETKDELLGAVAPAARRLLGADSCHLYVADPAADELRLQVAAPAGAPARPRIPIGELGHELARSRPGTIALPLLAGEELLGLLLVDGTGEVALARAVANQTAVALAKIDLIERLTEKNLIKDFFEELSGGRPLGDLDARAARLGFDVNGRYLVLVVSPAAEALEQALARRLPGSLFDRREDLVRALLRLPPDGEAAVAAAVREAVAPDGGAAGLSSVCEGIESFVAGFEEARDALVGATVLGREPAVLLYEELGAYKYLLRMSLDGGARDAHRDAVARLAEYDRERSAALVPTLEEFLRTRGSIGATAKALFVHPNTLRQRLARINDIAGIDLRRDDWLAVEIAVKLVKLEQALGREHRAARPTMAGPTR